MRTSSQVPRSASARLMTPEESGLSATGDPMKHNRIWLELVTVCAVAALILALGLAMLGVSAAVALAQGPDSSNIPAEKFQAGGEQTFSGVVTDSMCGAKHNTSMDQSAARCTK